MARVFVSHAGADLALAREVHGWLVEAGHEVFLDRDPRDGLVVGEQWEQRLYEWLRWADAVVCVVTSAYLASPWCTAEVGAAHARGSRLLPLRAEPDVIHPLLTATQHTDYLADPAQARTALVDALRRVDLSWPPDRSPFPGLRPFEADQHQVFFGRTEEVRQLAELLRSPAEHAEGAALLVVGPSGCGKSSLVRAGLLPVLADEPGWRALPPILPGADPVTALARELATAARRLSLDWTVEHTRHQLDQRGLTELADELLLADPAGPQQRLLIVLDQFEELLTQTPPAQRIRFAALLSPALTGPVRVVATLRPEFLAPLLLDPDLAAFSTRPYTLAPLRRETLRAVIEKPARLAGIEVDDGLVDRLVEDTDTGEALPLLAFTLAQLTDGVTTGGRLSYTRYDQLGGVQGALTRQADAALAEAIAVGGRSHDQVIAGLLRLVTVDEHSHPTRWRIHLTELPDHVCTELNTFVTRRLLSTDSDNGTVVIGVAHEAFLTAWPPLAQAIAQNVSALRARHAVEHAATAWHDGARPPTRLWTSGQLAAAVADTGARLRASNAVLSRPDGSTRRLPRYRMLVSDRVDLSQNARDFLHASIRRDRYRRRRITTVLSVLLVLALVAAGIAIVAQQRAQERQRIAIARQLILQANALRDTDPRAALQLGIAAERIHPDAATRAGLVNTLTTTQYAGAFTGEVGKVVDMLYRDSHTIVVHSEGGPVTLWDITDQARPRQIATLTSESVPVRKMALSPDRNMLLTAGTENAAILWDITYPAEPRRLAALASGTEGVDAVRFSPDGRSALIASGLSGLFWDLSFPDQPRQLSTFSASALAATLDGDNYFTVQTLSADGGAILWGAGDRIRPAPSNPNLYNPGVGVSAALSADESTALIDGADHLLLYDVSDRTRPRQLSTLSGSALALGPDGNTALTSSEDGPAILWDVTDRARPRQMATLTGHTGRVYSAMFSPDGRTVLTTAGFDGEAIFWDITDRFYPRQLSQIDPVAAATFSPEGDTAVTVSHDDPPIIWDLSDHTRPPRLDTLTDHADTVRAVAFSPDRRTALTGDGVNLIVWDLTDRAQPRRLSTLANEAQTIALSPDGYSILTSGRDGTVILWDFIDRIEPRRMSTFTTNATYDAPALAWSPDGRTALAGDSVISILWDLSDRAHPRKLGELPGSYSGDLGSEASEAAAFTPDGRIVLTATSTSSVMLWDISNPTQPDLLSYVSTPPGSLKDPDDTLNAVAFGPDERTVLTAGTEGTAILWDISDQAQPIRVATLTGHTGAVQAVASSPTGHTVLTAGADGAVILWDITEQATPRRIATLTGHTGVVQAVAFSPDGHTVLSGASDKTAILWDVAQLTEIVSHPSEYACTITREGLSVDEWANHVRDLPYQDTCGH